VRRINAESRSSLPPIDNDYLTEVLTKRSRLSGPEWDRKQGDLRGLLSDSTWTALFRVQEKFEIRKHFTR